jgi:hypothetical protein
VDAAEEIVSGRVLEFSFFDNFKIQLLSYPLDWPKELDLVREGLVLVGRWQYF